jgi:hypothetical protein
VRKPTAREAKRARAIYRSSEQIKLHTIYILITRVSIFVIFAQLEEPLGYVTIARGRLGLFEN